MLKTQKGERAFFTYVKNVMLKRYHKRVRVVFSYEDKVEGEPKVLAANRLDWDVKTILETYPLQRRIGVFYSGLSRCLVWGTTM
jgi:hypothetical protein